jgi:hypothetical protein
MFSRWKADRRIEKDLRAIAPSGVISKAQVLAVARQADKRGDHRGANELREWMFGSPPDRLHYWGVP